MTSLLQDPRNSRTGAGQSVGESSWSRPAGADSLPGLGRCYSPGRSRVLWEQLFRASPASPTGRGAQLSAHQPHLAVAGLSKFGFQLAGTPVLRTGQRGKNIADYMIVYGRKRLLKLVTKMLELDMETHVGMV